MLEDPGRNDSKIDTRYGPPISSLLAPEGSVVGRTDSSIAVGLSTADLNKYTSS